MKRRKVYTNIGAGGAATDRAPLLLPGQYVSGAVNFRFAANECVSFTGNRELAIAAAGETLPFVWVKFLATNVFNNFFVSTLNTLYYVEGPTAISVKTDLILSPQRLLDSTVFGGLLIVNDTGGIPQVVIRGDTDSASVIPLAHWPTDLRATFFVAFKSALFAFNLFDADGNSYPTRFRSSAFAEPGAIPASWDIADPTNEATSAVLPDEYNGNIVAAVVLGEKLIVFKDTCLYEITFAGGLKVWRARQLTDKIGLVAPRAYARLDAIGRAIVFFSGDDFYLFDGEKIVRTVFDNNKDYVLGLINYNTIGTSFMYVDLTRNEVVFCFPGPGDQFPTHSVRWNYKHNTEYFGRMYETSMVSVDYEKIPGDLIGPQIVDVEYSDLAMFSDDVGFEGFGEVRPKNSPIEVCVQTKPGLYVEAPGRARYGELPIAVWERTAIGIEDEDLRIDLYQRKIVTRINPRVTSGVIRVAVGVQEDEDSGIFWLAPMEYKSGDGWLDLPEPLAGRFFAFKIYAEGTATVRMQTLAFEYSVIGQV